MIALDIMFGFATAVAFSLAFVPLMLKLAVVYGLFDVPDAALSATKPDAEDFSSKHPRKVHSTPTPRLGGVAIVASFFITHFVWSYDTPLKGPLLASFFVFILGLVDDLYPLPAKVRLLAQVGLAAVAVKWGGIILPGIALGPELYFPIPKLMGFGLSVFIIVGAVNAINMIDGLDGLAGGIVLIAVSTLSFIYFLRTQDANLLLYFTIPMIGGILGFLRYNTYPASIFMGDSGSNWLGFMTGVLVLIVLGNKTLQVAGQDQFVLSPLAVTNGAKHIPLVSAIMCLAVPVFDTACVMIMRMRDGLNPLAADRRHFHHTLLKIGLSHTQSVSAVYFLALACSVLGVIPVVFNRYDFMWVPYIASVSLLLLIPISFGLKPEMVERLIKHRIFLRHHASWGGRFSTWLRLWESANRYVLYLILLGSPAFAGVIKPSIGYAAMAAAFLIIIVSLSTRGPSDFFDSICISLGAIVLLVANNSNVMSLELMGERVSIQHLYNGLFVFLLVSSLMLFLVTSKKRYFLFTPSDFLLCAIPLILLLVPEPYKTDYKLDIICLRSLVVFMTLRTMLKRRRQNSFHIKMITIASLTFVFLSGVFMMRIIY